LGWLFAQKLADSYKHATAWTSLKVGLTAEE